VKFLIDNNLSPLVADALKAAGHDAVHLRDLGLQAATDDVVLEHARADERILAPLTLISAACSLGPVPARRQWS
jgi:predicted nuclease of predicted toxin-antitoxin system